MVFGFRFCIEFIKNPQEIFEESMMFNMGQLLSVPFIVLGIVSLTIAGRQKQPAPLPDNTQRHHHHKPKSKPEKQTVVNQQKHNNIKPKKKKK